MAVFSNDLLRRLPPVYTADALHGLQMQLRAADIAHVVSDGAVQREGSVAQQAAGPGDAITPAQRQHPAAWQCGRSCCRD